MIRNPTLVYVFFVLFLLSHLSANCQRKRSGRHSHWTDTTGSAEIEQTRKLFWDSIPDPTGLTTDFENIFSREEKMKLDSIISGYEKKTSIEFCVVTIDTMKVNRERFSDLPDYLEKSWGIGKKKLQNGIVICISNGYKTIRIGRGLGITDYLDEYETTLIIKKNILPDFIKGKYFAGTMNGIYAIIDLIDNKMKGKSSALR